MSGRYIVYITRGVSVMATVPEEDAYRWAAAEMDLTISEYGRLAMDRMGRAARSFPLVDVPVVNTGDKITLPRRYALLCKQREAEGLPPVSLADVHAAVRAGAPYTVKVRRPRPAP